MKRIISVLLSVLILLSVMLPVAAKSTVELKVTDATVYAGDEFELKVFISDNSRLSGAVIDLQYDESMFEYVSAEKGAIIDDSAMVNIKNSSNKVRFTYMSPNASVTSEGILFTVKFKALENADGQSSVKLLIPSAGDFVSDNLEKLPYTVKNSTVKIINNTAVNDESTTESTTSDITTSMSELENSSTTGNATANNKDGKNNNDTDNIKIVIGVMVAGVVLVVGGIVYLIISKKKR